jgi:hypothetical protein
MQSMVNDRKVWCHESNQLIVCDKHKAACIYMHHKKSKDNRLNWGRREHRHNLIRSHVYAVGGSVNSSAKIPGQVQHPQPQSENLWVHLIENDDGVTDFILGRSSGRRLNEIQG